MSDNILNDIENAIYEFAVRYEEVHACMPRIIIKFSHEGYHRTRAEKMASCFFNSDHGMATMFAGYPFEEVHGQVETFKIELLN